MGEGERIQADNDGAGVESQKERAIVKRPKGYDLSFHHPST